MSTEAARDGFKLAGVSTASAASDSRADGVAKDGDVHAVCEDAEDNNDADGGVRPDESEQRLPSTAERLSSLFEMCDAAIPTGVKHWRSRAGRHPVWTVIHDLESSIMIGKITCRNLCLLCVEASVKRQPANPDAWRSGLCSTSNASSAGKHVTRVHKRHHIAKALFRDSTNRAEEKIKRSHAELEVHHGSGKHMDDQMLTPVKKTRSTIATYFRPSSQLINTTIAEWLTDDGLAYHTVTTPAFKRLIRVVSGNDRQSVLARDTFNDSIDGRFKMFCQTVSGLLAYLHDRLYGMRFLTLIHDAWTRNKRTGVIGASVAFIDHQWTFRHIALLTTVKNDGHASLPLSKLIEDQCIEKYNIDIGSMAKWTMSDTTASARGVATHFDETHQEDCCMHILSLCIGYGIGLKENVRTTKSRTPDGSSTKNVVTPGGPLPEGADVIRKLRSLNNFFCTPKRINRLVKIQEAHDLPRVLPLVDVEVRVASSCRLMRRSITNYTAMRLFILDLNKANVFSALTESDWALIQEMESVTRHLAQLTMSEVQSHSMVASYMLVFRTVAEANLKSRSFQCLKLRAAPRSAIIDHMEEREDVLVERFSKPGKVCVARCLAQERDRFPPLTTQEAIALLLDPRTKNCAAAIIDGMNVPTAHRDTLLMQAEETIVKEQIRLQKLRHDSNTPNTPHTAMTLPTSSQFSELISARPTSALFFGAPVPTHTKKGFQESSLTNEAVAMLRRWLSYQEDWVEVAIAQGVDSDRAQLSKSLCFKRDDGTVCWNVVELYRVDVLQWFKEIGEPKFPDIAILARIWLGKASSTAFQERVFSTAGIVMSPLRSQTDNARAEKQLLLRVNRGEIDC